MAFRLPNHAHSPYLKRSTLQLFGVCKAMVAGVNYLDPCRLKNSTDHGLDLQMKAMVDDFG